MFSGAELYELYMMGFLVVVMLIGLVNAYKRIVYDYNNLFLGAMWFSLAASAAIILYSATNAFTADDRLIALVIKFIG